jgi:hypothetical protein
VLKFPGKPTESPSPKKQTASVRCQSPRERGAQQLLPFQWSHLMRIVENLLQAMIFGAAGIVMIYALLTLR